LPYFFDDFLDVGIFVRVYSASVDNAQILKLVVHILHHRMELFPVIFKGGLIPPREIGGNFHFSTINTTHQEGGIVGGIFHQIKWHILFGAIIFVQKAGIIHGNGI